MEFHGGHALYGGTHIGSEPASCPGAKITLHCPGRSPETLVPGELERGLTRPDLLPSGYAIRRALVKFSEPRRMTGEA